jgi:hypothetical protein
MNVNKTKAMIMKGRKQQEKPSRLAEHKNMTSKEYQTMKVCCERCKSTVGRNCLKRHQNSQKCILESAKIQNETTEVTNNEITNMNTSNDNVNANMNVCHEISVNGMDKTSCPVPNCTYHTNTSYKMRQHFRSHHVKDTIVVIEDGPDPLPKCPKCGIFQKNVGEVHQQSSTCKQFAMRLNAKNMQIHNEMIAENTTFTVFGETIENVHEFKYLGRIVTDTDDDKATIVHNLNKAGNAWGQINRLLSQEKKRNLKAMTSIYCAIIQAILLYGSETWVMTGSNTLRRLEIFHRKCARFLTGQFIHQQENGDWIYPHTEDIFKQTGLEPIENYIEKRKVQVARYLSPESKAISDIANSLDIEINMEKVCWWKPKNPDYEQILINPIP